MCVASPSASPAGTRSGLGRVLVLIVLGAFLYGIGVQSARACLLATELSDRHTVAADEGLPDPCHGDSAMTRAACEPHCRSEATSARASPSLDLPVAAPPDLPAPVPAVSLVARRDGPSVSPPLDAGPPLHVLFHRFLL